MSRGDKEQSVREGADPFWGYVKGCFLFVFCALASLCDYSNGAEGENHAAIETAVRTNIVKFSFSNEGKSRVIVLNDREVGELYSILSNAKLSESKREIISYSVGESGDVMKNYGVPRGIRSMIEVTHSHSSGGQAQSEVLVFVGDKDNPIHKYFTHEYSDVDIKKFAEFINRIKSRVKSE